MMCSLLFLHFSHLVFILLV
uniref:Uncharacterized protein n=1 Tax=Rhizophora mucronata TaxID=61149 RepID=A0A2P2R162_RHIMU